MSIMPETNRIFSPRGLPAASGVEALRQARAQARNLVEVFRGRAALTPEQMAFTFLADDESPAAHVTYGGLDERARAIAAHLQQQCRPRDRVLLMYGPGLEYIAALAGCLYAGVVAVPVYPPDPLRVARTLPRLAAIVRDAQARAILGTATDLAWAGAMLGDLPGLESLIATDEIAAARQRDWREPELDRNSLAILQYTSGSTGEPKGVMIQHGNALQNLAQMEAAIDIEDAVVATWLPAYHDMGLFGGILQCWYSGRRNIMMSPLAFFQRPLRWLQAISDHRATTAGAPNFAYDLCVRKTTPDERRGLDLSCWRLALSGAEPVRPETMERFLAAFAVCGVRSDIFKPCYGLAESTLMVASTPTNAPAQVRAFDADRLSAGEAVAADEDTPSTLRLASCGQGVCGQDLLIVDPQSLTELPAGRSGEIWVAGLHVAAGYWKQPDATARTFNARTSTGRGPFLRTGDVGFIHDGELFISGRLKEMIIVQGRNHYPADLEQTAEASHDAV
ncbi:MAG: fatty acyl-AMP ligase, partial [Planctomycetaceae bacterium]|nr:fatty acyl-AMP ligase [Planctomycetaceae bacterium]